MLSSFHPSLHFHVFVSIATSYYYHFTLPTTASFFVPASIFNQHKHITKNRKKSIKEKNERVFEVQPLSLSLALSL
ncbi:unnamed protein product [Trifolium pratense]|uniref:Uncharacterized protein n=1 Tax=Trifolium pratense TaxID=57577 RepID=A0ACB0LN21_TRIPR|nr:unnamed protein product [Trifolium pratense]